MNKSFVTTSVIYLTTLVYTPIIARANTPYPVLVSATPSTGIGSTKTLTLVYGEPDGASNLSVVGVLINTSSDGRGSCWVNYDLAANRLWLVKDSALNWINATLGSNTTLQNPQCTVEVHSSSVSVSGNSMTLTLALSFTDAFVGTKTLYMRAANRAGMTTEYTAKGAWTIEQSNSVPTVPPPPISLSMSPASGSGTTQLFNFMYSDVNGYDNLSWVHVRLPSASNQESCWIAYNVPSNVISLANDDASKWSSKVVGSLGTLQNSQCIIDVGRSSRTSSGQELALKLALTFQPSFIGFKTVFMRAEDKIGRLVDYTPAGTWNILVSDPLTSHLPPLDVPTGTHWADTGDLTSLTGSLGYHFAIVTVAPSDVLKRQQILTEAKRTGIQLIIGAYPSPYSLQTDGQWKISSDGIMFLRDLANNASAVKAVFVFNEPYWVDPVTSTTDSCGVLSAVQLRALRTKIQSVWPQAKIYHDIGDPQSWRPGGGAWSACIGDKYQDQTDIADYVGVWYYPFNQGRYTRQQGLDFAYTASRYVLTAMKPAQPVFLAQSFSCPNCQTGGITMPTPDQIHDWNCSLRGVLPAGSLLSWYVWRQSPLYSDCLSNHPEYWPFTTQRSCGSGLF